MIRRRRRMFGAFGRGATVALSGAALLAAGEDEAFALDFLDDHFLSTTSFYGSAWIKDLGTPANDYDTSPDAAAASLLTYTSPSAKMIRHADGLYKFAAHNLMLHSNDFSQSSWLTTAMSKAANLVTPTAAHSTHIVYQAITTAISGASYTQRIRVKPNGYTKVALVENALTGFFVSFNLVGSGSIITQSSATGTITALDDGSYELTATSVAGGANFRLDLFVLNPAYVSGSVIGSWLADGVSGVYVYEAHLHRSPADDTYLATGASARYALPIEFDTDGTPLGLLVEEARPNLALWGSDLTNAAWVKTNATAAKTATGPDGVTNSASTLTATANNAVAHQRMVSASAARSGGVFLKRRTGSGTVTYGLGTTTGSEVVTNGTFASDVSGWTARTGCTISHSSGRLRATENGSASFLSVTQTLTVTAGKVYRVSVDLSALNGMTGTQIWVGSSPGGAQFLNLTAGTSPTTIVAYFVSTVTNPIFELIANKTDASGTDEWVEWDNVSVLECVETTAAVDSTWTRFSLENQTLTNPCLFVKLATSGDAVDVALAGVENGAFITSPIPTFGATVTRAADNISWADTGTLINANGGVGTLYVKSQITRYAINTALVSLNNSSSGEQSRQEIYLNSTTSALTLGRDASGSTTHAMSVGGLSAVPGPRIAALAFATNDFSLYVNGSAATPDTLGDVGTNANKIWVGRNYAGTNGHQHIQQILFVPRRASNAELQTLSTP